MLIDIKMWILKHLSSDLQFSLLPIKNVYTIGRSGADFLLTGDKSISRIHATIFISSSEKMLEIIDENSKHNICLKRGIEVKHNYIKPKTKIELKEGDNILFGKGKFEFIIQNHKFNCLTSNVNVSNKEELKTILRKLGGMIEEHISKTCTYLVMSEAMMTLKLLQAMVTGIAIIDIKYLRDVAKSISNSTIFPDPHIYKPKFNEQFILNRHISFGIVPQRSQLFKNKTMYMFSLRQYNCYKEIIEGANGRCICIKNQTISTNALVRKNAVVIQAGSEVTQTQTSSESRAQVTSLESFIRSKGLRLIPIVEIHLAVLNSSCEKYCNPEYVFDTVSKEHNKCNVELLVRDGICDIHMESEAHRANCSSYPLTAANECSANLKLTNHGNLQSSLVLTTTSNEKVSVMDPNQINRNTGLNTINDKSDTEKRKTTDCYMDKMCEEEILLSKNVGIQQIIIHNSKSINQPKTTPCQGNEAIVLPSDIIEQPDRGHEISSLVFNQTEFKDSYENPFGFKAFKNRKRHYTINNDGDIRALKLHKSLQEINNEPNSHIKSNDFTHLKPLRKNLQLYRSILPTSAWLKKSKELIDSNEKQSEYPEFKINNLERIFVMEIKKIIYTYQSAISKNYKRFVKTKQNRSESFHISLKSLIIGESQF